MSILQTCIRTLIFKVGNTSSGSLDFVLFVYWLAFRRLEAKLKFISVSGACIVIGLAFLSRVSKYPWSVLLSLSICE